MVIRWLSGMRPYADRRRLVLPASPTDWDPWRAIPPSVPEGGCSHTPSTRPLTDTLGKSSSVWIWCVQAGRQGAALPLVARGLPAHILRYGGALFSCRPLEPHTSAEILTFRHSYFHTFTHSRIHTITHSPIRTFTDPHTRTFTRSRTHTSTHSDRQTHAKLLVATRAPTGREFTPTDSCRGRSRGDLA